MTKLEFTFSTSSCQCLAVDETSAALLQASPGSQVADLLADDQEWQDLQEQIQSLLSGNNQFCTLDLVLKAPGIITDTEEEAAAVTAEGRGKRRRVDRSPIQGVFRSPIRAIHTSGEMELSCFVHLELLELERAGGGDTDDPPEDRICKLTAIEFSRQYRETKLRQEFGSWLLEEHIEKAVMATDPVGTVVFWNRFATELYQYEKEEAMGQSIMELTPSNCTQQQGMEIFGCLQQGQPWNGFLGVKRKDGSQFMAHVTDTPILQTIHPDQPPQLKFIVGVSADYSQMHSLLENLEQQVAERTKELLVQGEHLRMVGTAVQQSDTGVMICNDQYRISWCNAAARHLLALSSSGGDSDNSDKNNNTHTADEDTIINMHPWDLPIEFDLGAGKSGGEGRGGGGGVGNDPDLSYSTARQFFESKSRVSIPAHTRTTTTPTGSTNAEQQSPSTTTTPLQISVHYASSNPGGSNNPVILLRDLTAEKKADKAQRQAEKEAAASKSKTEMMCMLSHEFRTPLQGIMGIASTALLDLQEGTDIYDCLSTVAASSKLLLTLINNVLDLGKIEADKMQSLELHSFPVGPCIRDAITFCDSFAKQYDVKVGLDQASRELLQEYNPHAPAPTMILANRLRMEQILINLISNAIKYTRTGTSVTFNVRTCLFDEIITEVHFHADVSDLKLRPLRQKAEEYVRENPHTRVVVISIHDQGRGIPKDEMGLLFGEYSQLQVSLDKDRDDHGEHGHAHAFGQSSGSGLGLSLVLKFLAMMNGHIWVNSSESGACFSICLPEGEHTTSPTKRIKTNSNGDSPALAPDPLAYQDLRVLLVDDSLINLKVLDRMLRRAGVVQVKAMSRATEAVGWLKSKPDPDSLPNLILSDLQMPEMDGFEFILELRKMTSLFAKKNNNDTKPAVTIMACSADWTPESEQKCLASGFDGVLRKPIIFSALCDFLTSVAVR